MKLAEEWNRCFYGDAELQIKIIRAIQADSLRYAANLSGDLHRVHLLALADELETPGYSVPHPKP